MAVCNCDSFSLIFDGVSGGGEVGGGGGVFAECRDAVRSLSLSEIETSWKHTGMIMAINQISNCFYLENWILEISSYQINYLNQLRNLSENY